MSATGLFIGARAAPSRVAAGLTLLIGLLTLTGWTFDVRGLTSLLPGAVEMKSNTALCFLCAGAALMILADRASAAWEGLARALGAMAACIGAATVSEYLFGWELGIDQLLFRDHVARYTFAPGRMSPYTALALMSIGLALIGLRFRLADRGARVAAGITLTIGLVSLVGYLWNAGEIITDRWLPPVAANSALCLVSLGLGVLMVPERAEDGLHPGALVGIERRILLGFIAAITLLVLGGSFTYRNSVEFANSVQWVAHTQEVRASLSEVYGSLAGAEVAQRDYFLTKSQVPLSESRRLSLRVRASLDRLSQLLADNTVQLENLARLRALAERRLDTLDDGMHAFSDYGIPALRAVLTLARASSNVEDVGAQRERMDAIEEQLLRQRQSEAARVRMVTLVSLLVTLAIAVGFFIVLFRGIHREMFARRDAERALRNSDQYNRSIIDNSPDCVSVLTTGGHITQMNPQGMTLLGTYDFASIAGREWSSFWDGEARARAREAVHQARNGREGRFDGLINIGTSHERWLDVIINPVRASSGQAERLLAVARDVTHVKRGEEKLRSANQFLDSLIQTLPLMVVVKDVQTLQLVRVNRAFEQLIGVPRDKLIGKRAEEFLSEEEAESVTRQDRTALSTGKLVDVQQSVRTAHLGMRTFQTMKLPLLDAQGEPQFLLAISVDITERQLAEQAIHELNSAMMTKTAQLEATNKELESFSYSVSHDLRAPLRAIDGFAEIIQEDYREKLDEEGLRYLSVIRSNSRRMGMLIDDLLAFSRLGRQAVTRSHVNVDSLVREVIEEVLSTEASHDGSTAAIEIPAPLPPVHGDRTLLKQVWINLIANAVKYSSKNPQPRIEIRGETTAGGEVCYSVRDNGVGFSMDYVQKLFGVFNRLHRADEFSGTGVGLAIVQRIVVRHGGRVWAEGKVDEGALFSFALPTGDEGG